MITWSDTEKTSPVNKEKRKTPKKKKNNPETGQEGIVGKKGRVICPVPLAEGLQKKGKGTKGIEVNLSLFVDLLGGRVMEKRNKEIGGDKDFWSGDSGGREKKILNLKKKTLSLKAGKVE